MDKAKKMGKPLLGQEFLDMDTDEEDFEREGKEYSFFFLYIIFYKGFYRNFQIILIVYYYIYYYTML